MIEIIKKYGYGFVALINTMLDNIYSHDILFTLTI